MLTEKERDLYARQLGIGGWGIDTQEKLRNAHVFIAGTGGLGSPVLYYLAAAGVGNLTVCDSDVIDSTNLNRQILHTYRRIGENKVESARKSIEELNPFVTVHGLKERITGKNATTIITGYDLIIDCLDNFETRHEINRVSVKNKIPMIHAGVSGFNGQLTFLQTPETPCLACFMDVKDKKGTNYILGATAGVIGSLQALEAIRYLAGFGPSLKNRILFWDGASMNFALVTVKRNPCCDVCGKE